MSAWKQGEGASCGLQGVRSLGTMKYNGESEKIPGTKSWKLQQAGKN